MEFALRPFAVAEAEQIAHWAATREDLHHVSGADAWPLTAKAVTRWTLEANFAWTLRVNGDLAAYAEIVEDDVEGDAEIQHLLVAPDLRGQGVGRGMLTRLCAFLAAERPYPEVWMRAARGNIPAIRCAQGAGFEPSEAMSGPHYVWLRRSVRILEEASETV